MTNRLESIAQSFSSPEDCFLSGVYIPFRYLNTYEIHPSDVVTCSIRTLVNGYPSSDELNGTLGDPVSLNRTEAAASLNRNTGGGIANDKFYTKFYFPTPIKIEKGVSYAIVVTSQRRETQVWVAEKNRRHLVHSLSGFNQTPSVNTYGGAALPMAKGAFFASQDGITWTAFQEYDLTYVLLKAVFNKPAAGAKTIMTLKAKDKPFNSLCDYPFETEQNSGLVRVLAANHGLRTGNRVDIRFNSYNDINYQLSLRFSNWVSLYPGQIISSSTGSAMITATQQPTNIDFVYLVQFELISGFFTLNQPINIAAFQQTKRQFDKQTLSEQVVTDINLPAVSGTVYGVNMFPSTFLNGIPIQNIVKQHTVVNVDSIDSFIINVGINASSTGRCGAFYFKANTNFKYDAINVVGEVQEFGNPVKMSLKSRRFNPNVPGAIIDPIDYRTTSDIDIGNNYYFDYPQVYYNNFNHPSPTDDRHHFNIEIESDGNPNTTPVIKASSFGATLISNQVGLRSYNYNIAPNVNTKKDETDPFAGHNEFKYVTKTVFLNNEAIDLRILLDVYQDISADFKLYLKRVSSGNDTQIDDMPWQEISGFTKKPYANSTTLSEKIELDFTTNDLGILIGGQPWDDQKFISFKFKIVGTTFNSCKPPLFSNLRIIALT